MMEVTHPCAFNAQLGEREKPKSNDELTRDDLHANVFNHLKGKHTPPVEHKAGLLNSSSRR